MNKRTSGDWIYEYDEEYPFKYQLTNVRYVLGEIFDKDKKKALVCIGINPSIAIPEMLDPTLNRVRKYAKESGEYGAWYMLNVYPQRSTDPNCMDQELNESIHLKNLQQIAKLFDQLHSADVWCAWGGLINKRAYLRDCLADIAAILLPLVQEKKLKFLSRKSERESSERIPDPLHPIASVKTQSYDPFDLEGYIRQICPPSQEPGIIYSEDRKTLIKYQPAVKVSHYVMPESVRTVFYNAFLHCPELTSLTISHNVTLIDFVFPENLEEILIDERSEYYVSRGGVLYSRILSHYINGLVRYPPQKKDKEYRMLNVTNIVKDAFKGCTTLTSVTLPTGCNPLTSLCRLPRSIAEVKTVENDEYYRAIDGIVYTKDGSKLIYYPRAREGFRLRLLPSVQSADWMAFENCYRLRTLIVPADSKDNIWWDHLCPPELEEFDVDENNPYYMDLDGVLFSKDLKCLIRYPRGKAGKVYQIPEGVERIDECAFTECGKLETIVFPDSLQHIDNAMLYKRDLSVFLQIGASNPYWVVRNGVLYTKDMKVLFAFNYLSEEEAFVVPDGVEQIAPYAFLSCNRLRFIEMPGVQYIGESAFSQCKQLAKVKFSNSLKEVGGYAFSECNSLQSLEIKSEHSKLGERAFAECGELKHATVASTYIDSSVFGQCNKLETLSLTNRSRIEWQECNSIIDLDKCKNMKCVFCYKSMFEQIKNCFQRQNIFFID